MSILKLVKYPDPILKRVSSPIDVVDDNLRKFMDSMVKTMYHEGGVGLAAVQVGKLKRLFIIDISAEKNEPLYFINPKISFPVTSKEVMGEGCLSFPGAADKVDRFTEVEVEYLDYHGQSQRLRATGFLAQAIQHENDHLDGTVYLDHLSLIKRTLIKQKVKKAINKENKEN